MLTQTIVEDMSGGPPGNQPKSGLDYNPLMQQLVVGQRQFGTVRFPPKMESMEGKDFIRQFILQRVNIHSASSFGEGRTRTEKYKENSFNSYCLKNCTEEEKMIYNDPRLPDASAPGYEQWEKGVRNFASMLTTRMARRYLQLYSEKMPIHRSIKKQGTYLGAILDMIRRETSTKQKDKDAGDKQAGEITSGVL